MSPSFLAHFREAPIPQPAFQGYLSCKGGLGTSPHLHPHPATNGATNIAVGVVIIGGTPIAGWCRIDNLVKMDDV